MISKKPKVLLGMSGGVDSSLSAALLLEHGFEVIGGFMKNWSDGFQGVGCSSVQEENLKTRKPENIYPSECNWRTERRDAVRVAAQLDIQFYTFDFEKEYREKVVDYMIKEYEAGRTPNPDVLCNKYMKFDLFVKEADKLGCEYVATGHYARVEDGVLLAGKDQNKDQSYFLCQIPREILSRVIFPVGEMTKPEVRAEAKKRNLSVAEKPDSQGVCFIGEINMTEFLQERIAKKPGKIVTTDGIVVGDHEGIAFYTIGQREGLQIGGLQTPYYVVAKNAEKNELIVSSNFHEALFRTELIVSGMNWLVDRETWSVKREAFVCSARIRYRQPLEECEVTIPTSPNPSLKRRGDERLHVKFKKPQRAVTPGQFIVFYDGDVVLGGGTII